MVNIQTFQPTHTQGVIDLILPIQQQEFGIPVTIDDQPDLLGISGFYQQRNGNFWVALQGENVIGSIGLLDIGQSSAALRKMFVAPSHRGRAFGVAQALLDRLTAWCQTCGINTVYLGTTAQFLAAHRFYEKNGFAEIAKTSLPASFPVMKVDSKFYQLDVSTIARNS